MPKWSLGAALFLVLVSSGLAQDNRFSGGMLNGHAWLQMNDDGRAWYVVGVIETSSTLERNDPRRVVDLERCRCKATDLLQGVTNFYKAATGQNERLMRLPMLTVLEGEYWKRSGDPLEKISMLYAAMLAEIEKEDRQQNPPR